ncbi:MAG: tRNA preQ1(34) S-adenosylmethionine ribosyltransferase-isomerase QueA [Gammaproteobacteria bacterium]|nr:tRNA preQ1(34) S-adenosylmethionine ribosyltransferase-isomerase QueA [Gammaproteobacteria bacterium]
MRRADFHYQLPDELIARYPAAQRTGSRLLYLDGHNGSIDDRCFAELPQLLEPDDLLVFNRTRVIAARLQGRKQTGGRVELLVERLLDDPNEALVQLRASKPPQPGSNIELDDQTHARYCGRVGEFWHLRFNAPVADVLERLGTVPLPPYIDRADEALDGERYQTVYADRPGAVAAPTAGLHFDEPLLAALRQQGVAMSFLTLHVGAGTFQPVRVDDLDRHVMHAERIEVDQQTCDAVRSAQARGGRVIAVGTTSVRALETAAANGTIEPVNTETRLFIRPGYRFAVVDAMITNFHLPESTLMMLVSAFAGYDHIMQAYRHAVDQRYRFFSYGDAMFMTRNDNAF